MDANGTRFKLILGRGDWGRCLVGEDAGGPSGGTAGGPFGIPAGGTNDGAGGNGATVVRRLEADWAAARPPDEGTAWDADREELTLATSPWRFPKPAGEVPMTQAVRRGAAMDRYGNWYWIDDAETGIRVTSSGTGLTTPYWPVAPGAPGRRGRRAAEGGFGPLRVEAPVCPARLRGLAVTADHFLLVGTLDPGGLLAFDLQAGGPPLAVEWPADVPFAPWELAPRPAGGAYVLDGEAGARRVWRLDRHFLVEPLGVAPGASPSASTFGPADGSAAPPAGPAAPSAAISAADAVPIDGDPIDIAVVRDDLLAVLDRRGGEATSVVRLFDASIRELPRSPLRLHGLRRTVVAHAMAVITTEPGTGAGSGPGAEERLADVYIVDAMGDQAYAFPLDTRSRALRARSEFLPMRLFGGRALVATPDGPWYDCVDRWVPLAAQPRPQYAERAIVETGVFDSALAGCTWHRVLIDACIPSEAAVQVWSAASDDRDGLERAPAWTREPLPYERGDGPERPFLLTPRDDRYGTFELLLQAARGRYLRLRLELTGNRRTSPRLRALRVTYPRFSYLEQYLPHEYRDDPGSAQFLDGFLANLEGLFTTIEDRIAAVQLLFSARSAPAETLDWLASWFAVVLDPAWDEDRRRLFLRHAVELFRQRGTPRGLRMALGLAMLDCPDDRLFAADAPEEPGGIRIVERYQATRASATLFGDPTRASLPRTAEAAGRWTPGDGGTALHARYAAYLRRLVALGLLEMPAAADLRYPVQRPAPELGAAWQAFSDEVLGVVPSAGPGDLDRWQAFLRRRYLTPRAVSAAHRLLGSAVVTGFDQLQLPAALPADGPPLADWYAFESIVLRGVRAAHRFSVLLPVPAGRTTRPAVGAGDARDRRALQDRMARLVELEKPAHTVFDIRSYWLAFRVGEARLGKDTTLDLGSRSPDLFPPAVLGSMHLGEGVLTSSMGDVPARPAVFSGSVEAATRRIARRTDG